MQKKFLFIHNHWRYWQYKYQELRVKEWILIHPPSHIHYFSKKTITLLLEKNGFEVLSIKSCGYYRNLNFMLNKIGIISKYFGFFIKILSKYNLLDYDIYLNLHDIMFIFC